MKEGAEYLQNNNGSSLTKIAHCSSSVSFTALAHSTEHKEGSCWDSLSDANHVLNPEMLQLVGRNNNKPMSNQAIRG